METTVGAMKRLAAGLLTAAGMSEDHAARTAWALVVAEAWGRRSHGLLRLPYYLARFSAGGADPAAELRVVGDSGAVVAFDGGNGLGHWQLWEAATMATERSADFGIAAVSVGNSGHCGALGLYVTPMVEQGKIGLVFSNGPAVMPPWGGHSPVLSTSPLAMGVPTSPRPAIVDMATSTVARGKIAEAAAAGEQLPEGWAFDGHGAPTTDPAAALRGMLAPMGGAKGFALAFLVEALTGALVGPNLAGDVADPLSTDGAALPQRIGHLVIAVDPSRFDVDGHGQERLDLLARRVHDAGGRLPGAGRPLPSGIADADPLIITDTLAGQLAGLATERGLDRPADG
ncbi:MAG: Ldh family oxidoreductase [Acidimicrobiales bacterium]